MARDVLFVVHGMGVHEDGWEASVRAKLEEVAGRYGRFREQPSSLWERLELVPVGYDELFRKTLEQWEASGDVLGFARSHALVGAPDLSWLEPLADEDKGFFWTHAADVLIYRFFRLQREANRVHVARQIVENVPQAPDRDFGRCTVLAHSLGTAVVHDSLHILATEPLAGMPTGFHPLNARLRGIVMLANVSRVLQDDVVAYKSFVRGGPRNGKSSLCSSFHSFHHELDPFCIPRRFDPFAQAEGWSRLFNAVVALNHFRDWDVHGFGHYLDHPRVHVPLLNLACGENVVTPSEALQAVDAYQKFGGKLEAVPEIQGVLKEVGAQLKRLNENSDLGTLHDVYREVRRLLSEVRERIEELRARFEAEGEG